MRWSSALDALPILLDAVVEASWIAIVYLVLQVLGAHGPILLGPIQFALLAAVIGALGPLWIVLVAAVAVLAIPAGLLAAGLVTFFRAFLHPAATSTQTGPVASAIQVPQSAPGSGLVFGVVVAALLLGALAILAWRLLPARGPAQVAAARPGCRPDGCGGGIRGGAGSPGDSPGPGARG